MKNRTGIILLLFLVLLAGCEQDEWTDGTVPASDRRTVLVWLGTDNNFRAEATQKIETLRQSWEKNNDGNLLVYADASDRSALIHIYHSERKGNIADTLALYPPENSAGPATLIRVLNDVKTYRPAASYGLVVLSHATGWLPAEMSEPPRLKSVILDKTTNETDNYMELSDFANAIPYKLDFIIFDACFMGSVEVCYELKDKADYIVASPAEVLSPGFVYSSMMGHLFGTVGANDYSPLQAVARDFYEYHDSQSGLHRSATVSVIKTAELENLAAVFHSVLAQSPPVGDSGGLDMQCYGYGNQKIYFDLGDCIQKLSPGHYNDIQAALDRCVIYKACTPSYYSAGTGTMQLIRTFGGLSMYIPQAEYPVANEAYNKLKWAERARPAPPV